MKSTALLADPAPALKTNQFKLGNWEDEIGYHQTVRVDDTPNRDRNECAKPG